MSLSDCLGSLDRTNFVQDIFSRTTLEQYLLLIRREWIHSATLWTFHREMWAENGDALSRIYAGTGALNTSITRSGKRTLAGTTSYYLFNLMAHPDTGVLSDATKSVSRAYINNFQDKGKQVAIDMFVVCRKQYSPIAAEYAFKRVTSIHKDQSPSLIPFMTLSGLF